MLDLTFLPDAGTLYQFILVSHDIVNSLVVLPDVKKAPDTIQIGILNYPDIVPDYALRLDIY